VATLRGQYAHNTGIFTNNLPDGGFAKVHTDGLENSTVATWLQAAGYRTALFGKYLNGYPNTDSGKTYIPPGWTRWVSPNGGSPYSEYNYSLNQNGTTVSYGSAPEDYLVDVLSNKAATFINNTLTNYPNKPFFLYVAPYIPHGPATPPPRYANDFPGLQAPRTASFNEADVSDKPAWVRNKALLTSTQIANIDDFYRKRRQSIQAVGDLVENLVNTLQAKGELNNTYIFFTSDNGFHQGQHRLNSGKNSAYEEDLNVPLVVRGPGVPAGAVVNAITANVDLAPTWAEIAGVTPPSFVDGRSLLPFLSGATPPVWRQALLLEHGGPSITSSSSDPLLEPQDAFDVQASSTGGAPIFVGLRTKNQAIGTHGPINYVEYDTGERELYDLSVDPDQLTNSYSNADPVLKVKLANWLALLRNAAGQALRDAEQTPP
jgi:arylsulfatase A-like enzyme